MGEIFKVYHKGPRVIWEVSNLGRVKRNGKIYICKVNPWNNYLFFSRFYLHRALAELFIDNPYNEKCVDHIDTNRQNNNVNNLRWVSYKENSNNPISRTNLSKALSIALKNNKLNNSGINNGMYGKHHSQETKTTIGEKLSISWNNKTEDERKKVLEARSKSYGKRIWINKDGITKWVRIEDLHLYPKFSIGRK